tara:strand:+ start:3047 stop:4303 length:1257 start_codon:yes stop_codon:yes gene_type:complete
MYDWANSAFSTTVVAALLPIYYHQVAAIGLEQNLRTAYWGYTQTIALLIIAVLAPALGAAADYAGKKKIYLIWFVALGVIGTGLLTLVKEGDWLFASGVFVLGYVGFSGAEIFYESFLPHIAKRNQIDRVSSSGYAVGYIGGGLLLAVHLAWVTTPQSFGFVDSSQASRVAFLTAAIWWACFTIPFLRNVPEPVRHSPSNTERGHPVFYIGIKRVMKTFHEIHRYRELFTFLVAFWFYSDGINTVIKMAAIYGTEIGIGRTDLIGALLLVQFLGIPATFWFGALAHQIGPKRGIYIALVVYSAVSVLAFFMSEPWHFWVLAGCVALVQGGSQALSRSLYASMVPHDHSSEFFGLYGITSKAGNICGPLVFALISHMTGSSRLSILSLLVFFVVGMLLLSKVNIETGQATHENGASIEK